MILRVCTPIQDGVDNCPDTLERTGWGHNLLCNSLKLIVHHVIYLFITFLGSLPLARKLPAAMNKQDYTKMNLVRLIQPLFNVIHGTVQ